MTSKNQKAASNSGARKVRNTFILLVIVFFLAPILTIAVTMAADIIPKPSELYASPVLQDYSIEQIMDEDYLDYYNILSSEHLYRVSLQFDNTAKINQTYFYHSFQYETERSSYNSAYFIESDDIHKSELEIEYIIPAEQTGNIVGYIALPEDVIGLTYSYPYEDTFQDVVLELP